MEHERWSPGTLGSENAHSWKLLELLLLSLNLKNMYFLLVLMDCVVLCSVVCVILERAGDVPPAAATSGVTGSKQELCDVGSFKLLGWMLKITGT